MREAPCLLPCMHCQLIFGSRVPGTASAAELLRTLCTDDKVQALVQAALQGLGVSSMVSLRDAGCRLPLSATCWVVSLPAEVGPELWQLSPVARLHLLLPAVVLQLPVLRQRHNNLQSTLCDCTAEGCCSA